MKFRYERIMQIAGYKREFFGEVNIESDQTGTMVSFRSDQCAGRTSTSVKDLLNQGKTRLLFLDVTGKIMPAMNASDYIDFVQEIRRNASVVQSDRS
jgi:hypothetical protein